MLVSPWTLLVFLVIPLLTILNVALNIQLSPAGAVKPLFVNNICLALLVAARLLRYLAVMKKGIRYGAAHGAPRQRVRHPMPVPEVRAVLRDAGYSFNAAGSYGEKRDLGYMGTTFLYAGLFLLLATGLWDNLRQFSGVLLDGVGVATDLNRITSYRSIDRGFFTAVPASLPWMQIENQYLPDATYPMGATDLSLISQDGKVRKLLLKPGDTVSVGAYDMYMGKLVFEAEILIKRSDTDQPLFDSMVPLNQLVQKRGAYSFYGLFQGYDLGGGVYYQPEKNNLMVVVGRGGTKVVTDLVFQADRQVAQGDYTIACEKMGQWSEIHVVRRRHNGLMLFGGIVALMGLLLRIAIRPQRVWLEEAPEGSAIRQSSKKTMDRL